MRVRLRTPNRSVRRFRTFGRGFCAVPGEAAVVGMRAAASHGFTQDPLRASRR